MLQVLKDATFFFSHGTPSLPMVIPAMDYIDEVFTNSALKKEVLHPAICAAIRLGKRTLNCYYSLTDSLELYCIAMGKQLTIINVYTYSHSVLIVLHPCHKLKYFKLAGWKPPWIATACKLVNDRYDEHQEKSPPEFCHFLLLFMLLINLRLNSNIRKPPKV